MRTPVTALLLATAWLAGAGCSSAPEQKEPPVASNDRPCANPAYDPLHMVGSRPAIGRDPEIEALLNQSAEPRLAWVNRQMYLSLHSLDMELRREQRVTECEQAGTTAPTLEARTQSGAGASAAVVAGGGAGPGVGNGAGAGSGAGAGAPGVSGAGFGADAVADSNAGSGARSAAAAAAQSSIVSSVAPTATRSALIRKSSVSAMGGGGNGATAQKVSVGSDNDIVARRLRKAAEQEADPALRAKLWKEYADYRQGMAAR